MPDPTISEDTLPPEAHGGIRRIVVEEGDVRTIVQIRQEARESCEGEIHQTDGFGPVPQVVTNQQLVNACLAIAKSAVNAPRLHSLS
jgi:hypothetical protein